VNPSARSAQQLEAEDVWVLHLVATGPGPAAALRVRRALKALLRCYGLRCLLVRSPRAGELRELDDEARRGGRRQWPGAAGEG
jgi:hypothetical protein